MDNLEKFMLLGYPLFIICAIPSTVGWYLDPKWVTYFEVGILPHLLMSTHTFNWFSSLVILPLIWLGFILFLIQFYVRRSPIEKLNATEKRIKILLSSTVCFIPIWTFITDFSCLLFVFFLRFPLWNYAFQVLALSFGLASSAVCFLWMKFKI